MDMLRVISGIAQQSIKATTTNRRTNRRTELTPIMTGSTTDNHRQNDVGVDIDNSCEFGPSGTAGSTPRSPIEMAAGVTTLQTRSINGRSCWLWHQGVGRNGCEGSRYRQEGIAPFFSSRRCWAFWMVE
jgi:hypothetical protein